MGSDAIRPAGLGSGCADCMHTQLIFVQNILKSLTQSIHILIPKLTPRDTKIPKQNIPTVTHPLYQDSTRVTLDSSGEIGRERDGTASGGDLPTHPLEHDVWHCANIM